MRIPVNRKDEAREEIVKAIPKLASSGEKVFVRINKGLDGFDIVDLEVIITDGLKGIVVH